LMVVNRLPLAAQVEEVALHRFALHKYYPVLCPQSLHNA
jgi:hypothetical protein